MLAVGGSKLIECVTAIVGVVSKRPGIIFHSIDQSNNLIDFICQDDHHHFHAFQGTTGKSYKPKQLKIQKLIETLCNRVENALPPALPKTLQSTCWFSQ
jgi:hypothetical protein